MPPPPPNPSNANANANQSILRKAASLASQQRLRHAMICKNCGTPSYGIKLKKFCSTSCQQRFYYRNRKHP